METLGRGRGASAPKRYAYTPAACRLASWHLLWVTGDEWSDGDGESGRKLLGKRGGGGCEKGELWIKEGKWEGGKKIGAAKGVEWKSWGCWIKIERKEGKKRLEKEVMELGGAYFGNRRRMCTLKVWTPVGRDVENDTVFREIRRYSPRLFIFVLFSFFLKTPRSLNG